MLATRAPAVAEDAGAILPAERGMQQSRTDEQEHAEIVARLREIGLLDEPDLFAETVELFLTDAAAVVVQLQDAFTKGDSLALERAAHRLKGAALNLGVMTIATPSRALEDEARRHGFAGAPALIQTLADELERVGALLRAEVARARAAH